MLLNHKNALYFIIENPEYLHSLTVSKIEDININMLKQII